MFFECCNSLWQDFGLIVRSYSKNSNRAMRSRVEPALLCNFLNFNGVNLLPDLEVIHRLRSFFIS